MIEEDLKHLRILNPDIAALDLIVMKFKTVEHTLTELHTEAIDTEIQTTEEGRLWEDLNRKMKTMRSIIGETSFKLELSLARGHIDIKRLETAAKNIKVNVSRISFNVYIFIYSPDS